MLRQVGLCHANSFLPEYINDDDLMSVERYCGMDNQRVTLTGYYYGAINITFITSANTSAESRIGFAMFLSGKFAIVYKLPQLSHMSFLMGLCNYRTLLTSSGL